MDKLERKIRNAQDEVAEEALNEHLDLHRDKERSRALMLMGGFRTALRIAAVINSEVMRSIEVFQEERLYQTFGYDRFADFLDNHEHAPMSKAQYYERKAILDKEGDQVFDLLSDLGVSIRKRKLLGKGNVEIDGENVILHDGDEETSIALTDRTLLLQTLTALADANSDKAAKLDKQKQKLDKHDDEKRELYDEIDRTKAIRLADFGEEPHIVARVELGLAFRKMVEAAIALSPIERAQLRDGVLENVALWSGDLRNAYGSKTENKANAEPVLLGETIDEALDNFLDGTDLTGATNDAQLASSL